MRHVAIALLVFGGLTTAGTIARGAEADKKMPVEQHGKGTWLKRWVRSPYESESGRTSVKGAFREVVSPASQGTVRVLADGVPCSLGMVIHSDGYILTKASELDGKIDCVLRDGRRLPAERYSQYEKLDLALLKITAKNLPVVAWSDASIPAIGSWLATPNVDGEAAAIGVVSVQPRRIEEPIPILGVQLGTAPQGVRVNGVQRGTGAAIAGLRANDIIESFNGRSTDTVDTLQDLIHRMQPGDRVTLAVRRDSEVISVIATLGDRARSGDQEQIELMDSLGGPLSRRRAGFESVLQHDSVLRPRDCGGPVVDLDGMAVGVNIARASRVATYALPASVVRPIAEQMLKQGIAQNARSTQHPISANQ
jgi:serine protease Do